MVEAIKKRRWSGRLTAAAAIFCFGSVILALIGAIGTGQGAWDFRLGLTLLTYAFFAAALGVVIAIIAAVLARRAKPRLVFINLAAILVAGGFVAFVGNQIWIARSVPPIYDISTNLEDPPTFYALGFPAEQRDNVPDLGREDLRALPPRDRWKVIHRENYGDIAMIRVPWSVQETVARTRALVEERGWELVTADPQRGIVEAVDTSFFFRFKDNVVVRVRPVTEGNGSVVDMRSISRVGVSDIGVNARRVRDFLADLRRG